MNHSYRTADLVAAAAFSSAADAERIALTREVESEPTALLRLRTYLAANLDERRDAQALLWLDAWREAGRRPRVA